MEKGTSRVHGYVTRLLDALVAEVMADHPAVLVVGPRASGKTTTARRHARSVIRLDRPAEASAVRADPDVALAEGPFPLLLDEWQVVPEVLGAVKRAVDDDPRPGRFIITGSSQADLTAPGWPGTGRVVRIPMFGLVEREIAGTTAGPSIIDRLAAGEGHGLPVPADVPDLRGYVAAALRGGFPEAALSGSERARSRWLGSYVDQVVTRDLAQVGQIRDPVRLRRYLHAVAANTAGVVVHKTLFDAAGIDRSTATRFDTLLQQVFVTDLVPAYSSNRLNRLVRLPKRYLVDPALMRPLLGVDERAALRDGDVLGRLIDTFVVAQLRADQAMSTLDPRLYHLRDTNGRHEVDLVIELVDGRVIAIEIKADAAPGADAARHLIWLEESLGDRFAAGVVFHTGPRRIPYTTTIVGLPIATLWAPPPGR